MRRGLGMLVLLLFQGCISVGNYASPSLVGKGEWEVGVGTPLVITVVDSAGSGGTLIAPTTLIAPELFARHGVTRNLELEGRAVVSPFGLGALGGGYRWGVSDSGFQVAVGLSATYFAIGSSSDWLQILAFYPGVWLGTDRLYGALRGLWAVGSASNTEDDLVLVPGTFQIVVGQRLRGGMFDVLPELSCWLPSESFPRRMVFMVGLGIVFHPKRQGD